MSLQLSGLSHVLIFQDSKWSWFRQLVLHLVLYTIPTRDHVQKSTNDPPRAGIIGCVILI